jgi:hypothetical protein
VVPAAAWWKEIVLHAGNYMGEPDWTFAFDANGFSGPASRVSTYLLQQLEWTEMPARREGMPSLEALQTLLPKGRRLSWALVLPPARAPPAMAPATRRTTEQQFN